eukprot:TRINITY_DN5418_c0_g1_i3.p1 TRINITY_DN5418_c0_g1~~TRINITY_DN5418_c0_g1_i3.p1  ORF type:complete len:385 (-),score=110.76 TRINITY_DN5418_c0_g1_i3:282-1436(-)
MRSKGKPRSQKDIDKFQRNVDKHREAEKVYHKVREEVLNCVEEALLESHEKVNAYMKTILHFSQAYHTKTYEVASKLDEPLRLVESYITKPPVRRSHKAEILKGVEEVKDDGDDSDGADKEHLKQDSGVVAVDTKVEKSGDKLKERSAKVKAIEQTRRRQEEQAKIKAIEEKNKQQQEQILAMQQQMAQQQQMMMVAQQPQQPLADPFTQQQPGPFTQQQHPQHQQQSLATDPNFDPFGGSSGFDPDFDPFGTSAQPSQPMQYTASASPPASIPEAQPQKHQRPPMSQKPFPAAGTQNPFGKKQQHPQQTQQQRPAQSNATASSFDPDEDPFARPRAPPAMHPAPSYSAMQQAPNFDPFSSGPYPDLDPSRLRSSSSTSHTLNF